MGTAICAIWMKAVGGACVVKSDQSQEEGRACPGERGYRGADAQALRLWGGDPYGSGGSAWHHVAEEGMPLDSFPPGQPGTEGSGPADREKWDKEELGVT